LNTHQVIPSDRTMNKTLVLALLCSTHFLIATEYYENPFLGRTNLPERAEVVYQIEFRDADGNTTRGRKKLINFLDDGNVKPELNWNLGISESTFGETTTRSFYDVVNGLTEAMQTEDGGFSNSYYVIADGTPKSKTLAKGAQWESIGSGHMNLSQNPPSGSNYFGGEGFYGGELIGGSVQLIGRHEVKGRFTGLESIQTPWGTRTAAIVEYNATIYFSTLGFYTDNNVPLIKGTPYDWKSFYRTKINNIAPVFTTHLAYDSVRSNQKTYIIKNFGVYKREGEQNTSHPYLKSYTYLELFESTNIDITPGDFKEVQSNEVEKSVALDAWTWNGAYPWVYNANTDSWFYYRFNGNICYAYDVRSSKWFAFDEGNGGWRLAQ
jgi:hypothetical protein